MGKKIRYQIFKFALIQPLLQFTNKLQIGINPVSDPKGAKVGQFYYTMSNNTRAEWKGQKFLSTIDYDFTSNSSYMIFTFLNGYSQGYLLKGLDWNEFKSQHKYLNQLVEFKRALKGHQDDYEGADKGDK